MAEDNAGKDNTGSVPGTPYKGPEFSYNPTLRDPAPVTQAIPKEDYAKNPSRRNFLQGLGASLGIAGFLGAIGLVKNRIDSGQATGPEPADVIDQAAGQARQSASELDKSRAADPRILSPDHLPKNAATLQAVEAQQLVRPELATPVPETPGKWTVPAGEVTRTPTSVPAISPDNIKST